jgi:ABC-type multidrug transport system permease subunit
MSEKSKEMSEESDDPDSSSSSQKILTLAGMGLCVVQFAFFVYMICKFVEMDFGQGFKFMVLAYTSAFIYKNLEGSGAILIPADN